MQENIGAQVHSHSKKTKRHYPEVFYLEGPAGIFCIKRKNVHSNQGYLKAAVPAGKKYRQRHMDYNFKINCQRKKMQPLLVDNKEHCKVKADAENIKICHWGNVAL